MTPEYHAATCEHLWDLAPRLRAADRAEIDASTGVEPRVALACSLRLSAMTDAAMVDGRPEALFGVVPSGLLGRDGCVWFVGSDAAARRARLWLVDAPQWLKLLGDGYRKLFNHVDARNLAHVRWLRKMGFAVGDPKPWGLHGLAFRPFERAV